MGLFREGIELFRQGGIIMWPILGCSIVALTLIIERFIYFYRIRLNPGEYLTRIRKLLADDQAEEAVKICEANPSPVGKLVLAGLLNRHRDKEEIREAIEEAGLRELPEIERYLLVLAVIAKVSTLLGLLGTIQGMIQSFNVIAEAGLAGDPGGVARGISVALITTFAGLSVSIPTVVFYHHFQSRVQQLLLRMELVSFDLIAMLTKSKAS